MCTVQNRTESNFLGRKCLHSFHRNGLGSCTRLPADSAARLILTKFLGKTQKKRFERICPFFLTLLPRSCFSALLLNVPPPEELLCIPLSEARVTQLQFGRTELFADDLYLQHLGTRRFVNRYLPAYELHSGQTPKGGRRR